MRSRRTMDNGSGDLRTNYRPSFFGLREDAVALLNKILWHQDRDGGWWTVTFTSRTFLATRKPTWTGAAVILAIDAIEELTDGIACLKTIYSFLRTPRV